MLNFAVKYHSNINPNLIKIPENLENINNAKEYFTKALEYETHNSLQQETDKTKNPILYSVDLDTEEPGIIIGDLDDKQELLVYSKTKKEISNNSNNTSKKKKLKHQNN